VIIEQQHVKVRIYQIHDPRCCAGRLIAPTLPRTKFSVESFVWWGWTTAQIPIKPTIPIGSKEISCSPKLET